MCIRDRPIGTIVIILNVPLFVLGWRFIGKDFLFSSVYATAVSSLMIDGLAAVHTFKPMEQMCIRDRACCSLHYSKIPAPAQGKTALSPRWAKTATLPH